MTLLARGGFAAFILMNLILIGIHGVSTGGDTGMYVDGARGMLSDQPLTDRQPSYAGYVAVLALSLSAGAGLGGVVALQIAAATAAAYAAYRIAGALGGSLAGALTPWLLMLDFDTLRWHGYLLSDSLFASIATLAIWMVYRSAVTPGLAARLGAVLALLACAVVRPEGWGLVPAALVFWIIHAKWSAFAQGLAWCAMAGVCALLMFAVLPRLGANLTAVGPADMLRSGQTIWDFDGWRVSMPADAVFEDGDRTSRDAVVYAFRHPVSTATLMAARLGVHFVHVRPYYSRAHNAVVLLWLAPIYAMALWAFGATRRQPLTRWIAAALSSQLLVVALTHAEYNGRYLAHMMPVICAVAAAGLAAAYYRWFPDDVRHHGLLAARSPA